MAEKVSEAAIGQASVEETKAVREGKKEQKKEAVLPHLPAALPQQVVRLDGS